MKKKIFSLALAAMSLVAFTGVAQTQTSGNTVAQQETVKGKKTDKKGDKADKKKGDFRKGECKKGKGECKKGDRKASCQQGECKKGDRQKRNPYEGLTLTESQQTKLQQLDASRREARQKQMEARKETKQRNDSARKADRVAAQKNYLEEVKAIIGPDQYVVFLENMYINGGHNKAMKEGKHMAHGKSGKQGKNRDGKQSKNRDGKGRQAATAAQNAATSI